MRLSGRFVLSLAILASLASLAACQRRGDETAETLPRAQESAPPATSTAEQPDTASDTLPEGVLRAYEWECDGGLTLHMKNLFREDAITLEMHEGPRKLLRVRSASGAKYADETLSFWTKGESAMFERKGQPLISCRESRAKSLVADARERGVSYRGQGNEPGWTLEIGPGRSLIYVANYGQERHEFDDVTTAVDDGTGVTVYQARHGDMPIRVTVAKEACKDDMSGADFDHWFVVEFGGQTHRGCGLAL